MIDDYRLRRPGEVFLIPVRLNECEIPPFEIDSVRYLDRDVAKFFPSVDHEILRGILGRVIRDRAVIDLIDKILASGADVLRDEGLRVWFPGDDLFAVLRPRGLPIGNLTSQLWGNVYLNELDQFVKRELRVRGYLRYADDFLLFGDSKPQLWISGIPGLLGPSPIVVGECPACPAAVPLAVLAVFQAVDQRGSSDRLGDRVGRSCRARRYLGPASLLIERIS